MHTNVSNFSSNEDYCAGIDEFASPEGYSDSKYINISALSGQSGKEPRTKSDNGQGDQLPVQFTEFVETMQNEVKQVTAKLEDLQRALVLKEIENSQMRLTIMKLESRAHPTEASMGGCNQCLIL